MNIEKLKTYARRKLEGFRDWAHSFSHIQGVLDLLEDFFANMRVKVNKELLYKAAILHDLGRIKKGDHVKNCLKLIKKLDLEKKNKLIQIIKEHDYPKSKAKEIKTTEGKILWDIDNLESNGYIGLIRIQEHAKYLGKDKKWIFKEFKNVWYASPNNMHFSYTKKLMLIKKKEEKRYKEILKKLTL